MTHSDPSNVASVKSNLIMSGELWREVKELLPSKIITYLEETVKHGVEFVENLLSEASDDFANEPYIDTDLCEQ